MKTHLPPYTRPATFTGARPPTGARHPPGRRRGCGGICVLRGSTGGPCVGGGGAGRRRAHVVGVPGQPRHLLACAHIPQPHLRPPWIISKLNAIYMDLTACWGLPPCCALTARAARHQPEPRGWARGRGAAHEAAARRLNAGPVAWSPRSLSTKLFRPRCSRLLQHITEVASICSRAPHGGVVGGGQNVQAVRRVARHAHRALVAPELPQQRAAVRIKHLQRG